MPARVQVIVEAKDAASGILRGITSQFGAFGSAIEEVTGKSVNWGNVLAIGADIVVDALKKSVQATQEYASEVRDLALVSGTTAEEASRLIQVLDDYEITAEDITTATRKMTQNGLAPTIDSIAELSDRYVALNTAQEKNQFILDNLGRSGLGWANALSQGGDAIRALNESVNESLILDDNKIKQLEEYRLNLDQLNDNWMALQVTLGTTIVPVLNDVFNLFTEIADAQTELEAQGMGAYQAHRLALMGFTTEAELAADSMENLNDATLQSGEAALKVIPDYAKQLSMIEKLTGATESQIKAVAYQQLQQQLSEGGITEEENELLRQAGEALGIFDGNAIAAADAIGILNQRLAEGEIKLYTYIALLESIPTNINTTVTTTTSGVANQFSTPQASGGEVYAGNPYMVGEAGAEPFFPQQNGRILGHSESLRALSMGGGQGTNIFYGNVTLSIGGEDGDGLLAYR